MGAGGQVGLLGAAAPDIGLTLGPGHSTPAVATSSVLEQVSCIHRVNRVNDFGVTSSDIGLTLGSGHSIPAVATSSVLE